MRASISQTPGTLRPLVQLVWPVLAEQVLVMLVGFSDTLLAGHYLQESHLAAMTVISYALWMLTNLFAFVSIGAVAMTARFVGAGDWPAANRVVTQSFLLGAHPGDRVHHRSESCGAITWPACCNCEGEPAALATRYLRILVPMLPMMMLEAVGIGCLRGAGDMVTGLATMVLVNVVNITVAWSLLLGLGPLPEMGWDALPIGTACGLRLGGLIPSLVLLRGRGGLGISPRLFRPDWSLMRRILRIGVPGGIDVLSIVGCQLVVHLDRQPLEHRRSGRARRGDSHRVAGLSAGLCLSDRRRHAGRPVPGRRRLSAGDAQRAHGLRRQRIAADGRPGWCCSSAPISWCTCFSARRRRRGGHRAGAVAHRVDRDAALGAGAGADRRAARRGRHALAAGVHVHRLSGRAAAGGLLAGASPGAGASTAPGTPWWPTCWCAAR